jgi:hypothetical protein
VSVSAVEGLQTKPKRLLSLWSDPLRRTQSHEVLVHARIQSVPKCEVIVVFQRNEAKWLHDFVLGFAGWLQDLRHAFDRARFRLEGDLDQIALLQRPGQSQHAAGLGNGLQLRSRASPISQLDDHGN